MKKISKKILCILLSMLLVFSTCGGAVTVFAANTPRIEGDTFIRLSFGEELDFMLDYDKVVDTFRQGLKNREKEIELRFATCDKRYAYSDTQDSILTKRTAFLLINRILMDAFAYDPSDPFSGEYLQHSINTGVIPFMPGYASYTNKMDVLDGVQYYTYTLSISGIEYYTDLEQEKFLERFIEEFNKKYIKPGDSDYKKVKTIYDFIARNTDYDNSVKNGKFEERSDRYKRSHSAYGAICGNIADEDFNFVPFTGSLEPGSKDFSRYFDTFFSPVKTVEDQCVVADYNNGLSVCEGYSKLFYALCISNGIPCHIVDGNYAEGITNDNGVQLHDPHEWNYVWVDDGVGDDGYQWYQIDTTFGSQHSFKKIDYNSYDFFLVGSGNTNMSRENHQQPYRIQYNSLGDIVVFDYDESDDMLSTFGFQLHDWYGDCKSSVTDYRYPIYDFVEMGEDFASDVVSDVIVERSYEYNGKQRGAYLLIGKDEEGNYTSTLYEINEKGQLVENEDGIKGFPYRSLSDVEYNFSFQIPYVVNTGNKHDVTVSSDQHMLVDAGDYDVHIRGNEEDFIVKVPIIPLDMSGDADKQYNENYSDVSTVSRGAPYNGNAISPVVSITDGFDYHLQSGKDYDVRFYADPAHTQPLDEIKDMGVYYVRIEYHGNYVGNFNIRFIIGKVDLSFLESEDYNISYMPRPMRKRNNINNIGEYYIRGAGKMSIGEFNVQPNRDFAVTYTTPASDKTGLEYGSMGNLILTGIPDSDIIEGGTYKVYPYAVNKKFDISAFKFNNSNNGLEGQPANSSAYIYTGSPIKPTSFDNLSYVLDSDEYEIVDYKNCTNAGTATLTVKGKGGCTGTANMYYVIQKKSIAANMVSVVQSGNTLYLNVEYNGMTLKSGTDFTLKKETNKLTISAVPNGNYSGDFAIGGTGIGNMNIVFGKPSGSTGGNAPVAHTHSVKTSTTKASTTKNGSVVKTCMTCGAKISSSVIYYPKTITLSATKYTYDGKVKKPTVKVVDANGKTVAASNYTVTYASGRKNVGAYAVKITFKGNYSGSVTKTFNINPKGTALSSVSADKKAFTAKWKKQATQTTGYEIQYATDSKFTKNKKSVAVTKNSTTSKKVTGLKAKTKYFVRIRTYKTVGGKKYYSAWSSAKTVTTKK